MVLEQVIPTRTLIAVAAFVLLPSLPQLKGPSKWRHVGKNVLMGTFFREGGEV